jgi:hypothetical protein
MQLITDPIHVDTGDVFTNEYFTIALTPERIELIKQRSAAVHVLTDALFVTWIDCDAWICTETKEFLPCPSLKMYTFGDIAEGEYRYRVSTHMVVGRAFVKWGASDNSTETREFSIQEICEIAEELTYLEANN